MSKISAEFVWCVGMVAWLVIRHPYSRRARKAVVTVTFHDRLEWALLITAALGLFVLPAAYVATGFPSKLDRPFSPALAWLGVPVIVGAIWLFWRSHAELGRNWSATLKIRKGHSLVTGGVYRLIRHPMYSSFLLLGAAQFLLLPNWFVGLIGIASALLLFLLRVEREEKMMIDLFGEEYVAYRARTKRIIPWIF
jgi:protein-S-isoprenylcysteine O-methyltransferase Ste14